MLLVDGQPRKEWRTGVVTSPLISHIDDLPEGILRYPAEHGGINLCIKQLLHAVHVGPQCASHGLYYL